MDYARYNEYLKQLRRDYRKLTRLEFLNPDGNVAFALDNSYKNKRSHALIQEGELTVNLNNGRRRQASIVLSNLDDEYEYAVNKIWFGQQIRLSMGLVLPDGTDYYIPQGIFLIEQPDETLKPGKKTVSYALVDKWALFDGTLGGNLEGPYQVLAGTNIFDAIDSIRRLDKYDMSNNGTYPIDSVPPIFTNYYNDKTQTLTDGTTAKLIEAPYDYTSEDEGTLGGVILGLSEMLAAWTGYNANGRLVIDPSQDDIDDATKPILWSFRNGEAQFLESSYSTDVSSICNDLIVTGDALDNNPTARGRAQNQDPTSDTCISRIGLKTARISMSNYYSNDICEAYAEWQLKRLAAVSKSITISCTQMFHLYENAIVELQRPDRPDVAFERHVIQGYTIPLAQTGNMTINAISTQDFPDATIVPSSN